MRRCLIVLAAMALCMCAGVKHTGGGVNVEIRGFKCYDGRCTVDVSVRSPSVYVKDIDVYVMGKGGKMIYMDTFRICERVYGSKTFEIKIPRPPKGSAVEVYVVCSRGGMEIVKRVERTFE